MKTFIRGCTVLLLSLSLAACPRLSKPPPAPALNTRAESPPRPNIPGATLFAIDPATTELHILVYRGGAMASLGHNHVVSSKDIQGWIWLQPALESSGFDLVLPVAGLLVDEPDSRRAEGSDFAAAVPDDARQGTYTNMLRPEVLDGLQYPAIILKSSKIAGNLQQPVVTARITLKDRTREVKIPTVLTLAGDDVTVTGEFKLKQTDFGMTPFSVALGALRVEDEITIKFQLRATKAKEQR